MEKNSEKKIVLLFIKKNSIGGIQNKIIVYPLEE